MVNQMPPIFFQGPKMNTENKFYSLTYSWVRVNLWINHKIFLPGDHGKNLLPQPSGAKRAVHEGLFPE